MARRSFTRRELLRGAAGAMIGSALSANLISRMNAQPSGPLRRVFDVAKYGARGDGTTPDTAAIQRAIDEAAAAAAGASVPPQVLIRGGKKYRIGALQLRGGVEFHLADDAELVVSTNEADFGTRPAIGAEKAAGLRITGTGIINGLSRAFMDHYAADTEWWQPKRFRPRLAVLTGCKDLEVRDITFRDAPLWTLHLLGCEDVLVEGVQIRNQMDVPNCDGIDPDHCRNVEIKRCHIVCGDDAIVIKSTRQPTSYGPSTRIRVSDCILETQDSGLKIGTETTQDISDVRFERCEVRQGARGLCIQLRDEGNVSNVEFRDITFTARYFSDPWWGRGEAISFTAIPRRADAKVGQMSDIRVVNVRGRAENSVRIDGSAASRVRDVRLENVDVTFDRWTKYRGGVWDNRPTTALTELEEHRTCGFGIRHADGIALQNCSVKWGTNIPEYFSHALEAEDVTGLDYGSFKGEAAHPSREKAVVIR